MPMSGRLQPKCHLGVGLRERIASRGCCVLLTMRQNLARIIFFQCPRSIARLLIVLRMLILPAREVVGSVRGRELRLSVVTGPASRGFIQDQRPCLSARRTHLGSCSDIRGSGCAATHGCNPGDSRPNVRRHLFAKSCPGLLSPPPQSRSAWLRCRLEIMRQPRTHRLLPRTHPSIGSRSTIAKRPSAAWSARLRSNQFAARVLACNVPAGEAGRLPLPSPHTGRCPLASNPNAATPAQCSECPCKRCPRSKM